MDKALRVITRLDESHGEHLSSLSALLLRTESVASSQIEHIEATVEKYARAFHGIQANVFATSMVASTLALHDLIGSVGRDRDKDVELTSILVAHQTLMADDPVELAYAGRVRDMQNWIGGSDFSPRGALYIPPPTETVDASLAYVIEFANRNDLKHSLKRQ